MHELLVLPSMRCPNLLSLVITPTLHSHHTDLVNFCISLSRVLDPITPFVLARAYHTSISTDRLWLPHFLLPHCFFSLWIFILFCCPTSSVLQVECTCHMLSTRHTPTTTFAIAKPKPKARQSHLRSICVANQALAGKNKIQKGQETPTQTHLHTLANSHTYCIVEKCPWNSKYSVHSCYETNFICLPSSVCSKRLPIRRQLVNTLPKSIFIGVYVCVVVCLSVCLSLHSALLYTMLRIGFLPSVHAASHSFIHSFIHSSVSHIRVPLVWLPHIRRCVGATSRVSALFFSNSFSSVEPNLLLPCCLPASSVYAIAQCRLFVCFLRFF